MVGWGEPTRLVGAGFIYSTWDTYIVHRNDRGHWIAIREPDARFID